MRCLVPLFLCAVATLCIGNMETTDIANLEGSAEMIHADAEVHADAKIQAKVSTATDAKVTSKVKAASKVATRATVMIGTHELDSEAVSMAKAKLHKVVSKIGSRHPEFLGETAQVTSLIEQGTSSGYVAGGYVKLKRILAKVDEFEKELIVEHDTQDKRRNEILASCDAGAKKIAQGQADLEKKRLNAENTITNKKALISKLMADIETSMASEAGPAMEQTMMKVVSDSKNAYDKYWAETEERHQVRNVLMQALWLVCVGFRKFRHAAYCTTLRKQPDYKEGESNKWEDESGNDYEKNLLNTQKFAETMTPIWEQQKIADRAAANRADGDTDMEKGFVNNRAPWGVDPAASGGEEKEMTSEQMSSRLSFLIQTSYTPERIATPINSFISAIQEGDEATQRSLVAALVNIDREEGQAQSALDAEWYATMVDNWKMQHQITVNQYLERKNQEDFHDKITAAHEDIGLAQNGLNRDMEQEKANIKTGRNLQDECKINLVEVEAILFVNEEELVNIMRLNSLLRFLVIGEKPVCSGCKDENKGSCTWVTRGAEAKGADAEKVENNCKNLQGDAVKCNYADSGHNDHYSHRSAVFCACEYGYYGDQNNVSPTGMPLAQDCEKMKCPGYGRILYPKSATALAVTGRKVIARCSSKWWKPSGICDDTQGICTKCFTTTDKVHFTPDNVETAVMIRPYPYHGKKRKCEHWTCPHKETALGSDKFYYKPADTTGICSGHGTCGEDSYGYSTGECQCEEPWYGAACHRHKCQGGKDGGVWFKANSPNVCNSKGTCLDRKGEDGLGLGACKCSERFHGEFCQHKRCAGFDKKLEEAGKPNGSCPRARCNEQTGSCICNEGGGHGCGRENQDDECPTGCDFKACTKECSKAGKCDRISGQCTCDMSQLLNGPLCKKPHRCDERKSDWSLTFDKWGWSTCKHGYLLTGLSTDRQGTADALYNLAQATCAKPCEGDTREIIPIDKYACYHENWWKKFDKSGGKYCRRNYFVAGLFRSHCNSLYCLEMAKCCQVRKSLWTGCKWIKNKGWTGTKGGIKVTNSDGFIVGFWRNNVHTLNGITNIRVCTPIWWGLFDPEAER